jgi:D-2-hydroxyacid dehydrogenase (NADP+)
MLRMVNDLIIKNILYAVKNRWKSSADLKVLISTNRYFNKKSWINTITSSSYATITKHWEIVYCKNRLEVYKHFRDADICFLFGYGSFLSTINTSKKVLYFPILGLEFLNQKKLPPGYKIEQPPTASKAAISEYCLGMAIVLTRNLQSIFLKQLNQKWDQQRILESKFVPVSAMNIGILGVGNVGRSIAHQFKKIGCHVAGCDKNMQENITEIDKWYSPKDLADFLKTTDVLIIALSSTEETENMIGIQELKMLGSDSYLINISRGNIIVEKDLIEALRLKIIKGAVIDVFSREPLPGSSPLYKLDNVILTPHISGNINLFVAEIQEDFINKVSIIPEDV